MIPTLWNSWISLKTCTQNKCSFFCSHDQLNIQFIGKLVIFSSEWIKWIQFWCFRLRYHSKWDSNVWMWKCSPASAWMRFYVPGKWCDLFGFSLSLVLSSWQFFDSYLQFDFFFKFFAIFFLFVFGFSFGFLILSVFLCTTWCVYIYTNIAIII